MCACRSDGRLCGSSLSSSYPFSSNVCLSFLLHSQKKAAPKKKKATKKKAAPKKKKATKVRVRSVWCVCECANVRVSVSVLVLVALF